MIFPILYPPQVLAELKEYATEVDVDFVRKAVRAIGRCAIKVEASVSCDGIPRVPFILSLQCILTFIKIIKHVVKVLQNF